MVHQFEITGKIESVRVIDFGASFEVKSDDRQGKSVNVCATTLTEGFSDVLSAKAGTHVTCSGSYDNNSFSAEKITLG